MQQQGPRIRYTDVQGWISMCTRRGATPSGRMIRTCLEIRSTEKASNLRNQEQWSHDAEHSLDNSVSDGAWNYCGWDDNNQELWEKKASYSMTISWSDAITTTTGVVRHDTFVGQTRHNNAFLVNLRGAIGGESNRPITHSHHFAVKVVISKNFSSEGFPPKTWAPIVPADQRYMQKWRLSNRIDRYARPLRSVKGECWFAIRYQMNKEHAHLWTPLRGGPYEVFHMEIHGTPSHMSKKTTDEFTSMPCSNGHSFERLSTYDIHEIDQTKTP